MNEKIDLRPERRKYIYCRVFEIRVLRIMCGPTEEETTERTRRVIKSRRVT
jgi:hypothetical protein